MFVNSIKCDEARLLMREGGQLIDVRSTEEFLRGSLPGALNLPLNRLQQMSDVLNRSAPVLVYCVGGQRSHQAARMLERSGFTSVYDVGSYSNLMACA